LENRGIQTTNDSKGQFFRTKTYWNFFDSRIKSVLDNRHQAKHNDTGSRNNKKAINKDHSKKNAASTVKAVTDVDTTFVHPNAEQTPFSRDSFDLVTMVYVLHQAPLESRDRILREAHRVLKPGGILAVVDISPEYEPSDAMIAEEPYLKEYQSNYRTQFHRFPLGGSFSQDRLHVAPVILSVFVKPESKSLVKGRRRPPGWRNRWIRLNDSRKEKSNLKENGWQIIGRTLPRPNERQYRNTDRNKRDKWVYVDE
jgi:SAM-dependent methyltransferase